MQLKNLLDFFFRWKVFLFITAQDTPENEALQPSGSFDGEPLKKCGGRPNSVVSVARVWKKGGKRCAEITNDEKNHLKILI